MILLQGRLCEIFTRRFLPLRFRLCNSSVESILRSKTKITGSSSSMCKTRKFFTAPNSFRRCNTESQTHCAVGKIYGSGGRFKTTVLLLVLTGEPPPPCENQVPKILSDTGVTPDDDEIHNLLTGGYLLLPEKSH
ncbi:hypothetical protein U1Q18_007838 [Sarracenia purpurea var. burkii]